MAEDQSNSVINQASVDAMKAAKPHWSTDGSGNGTSENQRAMDKTRAAAGQQKITLRHKGGPINKTGNYRLKKGEHVLAPDETKKVKAMVSGIKSLKRSGK